MASQYDHEPVYDPDQDPEKKRDIRRKYRKHQQVLNDKHDTITIEEVTDTLHDTDALFGDVRDINAATNDSSLLLQISEIGAAKARAMKSGSGAFDTDDFVARLITFMGGRKPAAPSRLDDEDEDDGSEFDGGDAPLNWERLGRRVLARSRRVPAMDFMLGPLSIEQKKRAAVKRAKLEKNKEDMKKPQEIREEDITRSGNETSKNVLELEAILGEITGSLNIFKFIINPHDFGQSVENLFYVSFLIRDGKCAFYTDDETGEPVILLCEQPTQEDYDNDLKKHQLVMEFDMNVWRRAIEVFDIREPMIPQRPKSTMRIGQKWYG